MKRMPLVSPDSIARHALAPRIDNLLTRLEREAKQLDFYAGERVLLAIECLHRGVCTLGGDAIQYAEQTLDAPWEEQGSFSHSYSTRILRHRLELARHATGV